MKQVFPGGGPLRVTVALSLRYAPLPFAALLVQAVLAGFVTPLSVYAQGAVFDGALAVLGDKAQLGQLAGPLVVMAASLVYPGLLHVLRWSVLQPVFALRMRLGLRDLLCRKCLGMEYAYFEDPACADSVDRLFAEGDETVTHMAVFYVSSILTSAVSIAGFSRYLGAAAWWLPVTVMTPHLIRELFLNGFYARIYGVMWENHRLLRTAQILDRYMRAREYIKEMKLFRAFAWMSRQYTSRLRAYNVAYEKEYVKNVGANAALLLFMYTCRAANVIALLAMYLHGRLSIGLFLAIALQIFSFSVWFGVGGFQLHKKVLEQYRRLLALEDEPDGVIEVVPREPRIELRDLRFRYPQTAAYALDGVSLTIEAGERVSLVGENGAGKSTLVKLILGLYECERGVVLVDGRDVREYTRSARAGLFAAVFQDFVRYSLTVRESLAMGSLSHLGDERSLETASERGGFLCAARRLGWDQLIGREFSGGTDLSGGEWQRLVLSRAFVGDRPIALLDEPTSQLDPMAEAELYRGFARAGQGKTLLLVTHRLGSTMITDRIVVLRRGRIVEQGTHVELMAQCGYYATMFDAQRQWYSAWPVPVADEGANPSGNR